MKLDLILIINGTPNKKMKFQSMERSLLIICTAEPVDEDFDGAVIISCEVICGVSV